MGTEIFFYTLYNNIGLYLIALAIVILLYIPIIKQTVRSIIDPMFIALIGAIFANAVPFYLYFTSNISDEKFVHFILSESIFWAAYFIFRNKGETRLSNIKIDDEKISMSLFHVFLVIMIMSNLLTYYVSGIPLLMASRLETYTNGGGIGILSHLINFTTFYCTVYLFYLFSIGKKFEGSLTLVLILIFNVLAGSKSAILGILIAYFVYLYFYRNKSINTKKLLLFSPVILIFPIITISIHSNHGFTDSVLSLLERFVIYGDCYYYAYPYEIVDKINITNPFKYLFSGLLGPLRLIDSSSIEDAIGYQLARINYPGLSTLSGPNTRLSLLNWILFGWNGLVLCFVLGAFFAWVKTRLCRMFPRSISSVIIYGYIYSKTITILTDPVLAFSRMFTLIIFFGILLSLLFMLNKTKIKFYTPQS